MSETHNTPSSNKYHVKVGLAEYTVTCQSEQEAVRVARQKLHNEMPHMRTVISNIMDKHIRVDRVS